jgi:ectoine hydroxylase-related dioxygenase (phytanoyl-CoA dioxygenase family)
MPIDPMNKENGGLWVDKNNFKSEGPEELVWLEALPGDMLFMHPNLYHGSGPNESKTNGRRTLLTGFCAYGANHKAYPGAGVSVRVTLTDKISLQASPWQQDSVLTGSKMH